MANKKINELTLATSLSTSMQMETDIGGITSNKVNFTQLAAYILSGEAATATALATARNINGVPFDGTANITVTAAAGTLTGSTLNATVLASSLTSVGTITSGTWNGTLLAGQYGGTGVNNSGKTITLGGNLTTSGAFTTTLTVGANTNVTLPASGTLATLAGTETFTNKTLTAPAINGGVIDGTSTVQGYRPINAQTGTTYTLVLADAGKHITLTNAASITFTVPLNATVAYPVGTEIEISQGGAGQVTIAATGGVTLHSFNSDLKLAGIYAGATLKKTATDTWLVVGNLTA